MYMDIASNLEPGIFSPKKIMHIDLNPLGFVESKNMWLPLVSDSFGSKCVIIYNNTFTDSDIKNQFMRCHRRGGGVMHNINGHVC